MSRAHVLGRAEMPQHGGKLLSYFRVWWHGAEPPHTIQLDGYVYSRMDEPDGTPVRREVSHEG